MICYLNGRLMPVAEANISILDRGFIFGDGVYEVVAAYGGRMLGGDGHIRRLLRSMSEIRIANPHSEPEWERLIESVIAANPWKDQSVYIQVTRGVAKRNHAFPQGVAPTVFIMASELVLPSSEEVERGVAAVTAADTRWARCDIKSTALLATVLLRQHSVEHNAYETILLRDGKLSEGSGSNIFVVKEGVVSTPPTSNRILAGITRDIVIDIAAADRLKIHEREVTEAELRSADELWLTSSPKEVLGITSLDGKPVGDGAVGPVFRRVWALYQKAKERLRPAAASALRSASA